MKKTLALLSLIILAACSTSKSTTAIKTNNTTQKVSKTITKTANTKTHSSNTAVAKKAVKKVKTMLIGKEDRTALEAAPFGTWFNKNYAAYTTKDDTTPQSKKGLKGVTITTFMGTWCSDSKRETPRMLKILDAAKFKDKNFTLITVDRSKKKPTEFTTGNNIIRVPTFIFKKDGKEIGRIVERPVESLEKDMLKILNGEPYKHAYEK